MHSGPEAKARAAKAHHESLAARREDRRRRMLDKIAAAQASGDAEQAEWWADLLESIG